MNEIIINKDKIINDVFLITNGRMVEKYQYSDEKDSIEKNIYIGIIKGILNGMQAAFVDIGENKNAFIHLEEILGKDYSNKDVSKLKIGMPVMVQVKKDAVDTKGARVTTKIQLSGRFCVLLVNETFITISQKVEDKKEKERLVEIAKKYLPDGCGAILRTSATGKSEEDIKKDLESLIERWKEIKNKYSDKSTNPIILYKNFNVAEKMIIDMLDKDTSKIIVNSKEVYNEVKKLLSNLKYEQDILELKEENLLKMYDIEKTIDELSKRKIWLKCGGFITIDKTEALTAIDVNSGKFVGKENLEKTVFIVNKDACIEVARQIRLRDIGGIIIIDFIDMQNEENKQEIINILNKYLKEDRAKTQIMEFTKLNLLEMTRKHMHS